MKRYEATVFDLTEDRDDHLLVTSHESCNSPSMTIHCSGDSGYEHLSVYITKGQAYDLIGQLQRAIVNIEVYQKTHNKEV